MEIMACDVPKKSALELDRLKLAYFRDSYSAPLSYMTNNIVEIFFAIFGHHPKWMKLIIVFRNKLVSVFGLEAATDAEVLKPELKSHYVVGEKIGPWQIYQLTEDELIAGRDNKHLDFRLSVLKCVQCQKANVVVSTVCNVHNVFGKIYLFFVVPFHKWGVKKIMANAVLNGRL
jgi:hypothetical protein